MSALKWGADYHGARICRKTRSQHNLLVESHANLLAALERIVGEHADLGELDLSNDERDALDQARAAIAKAKGTV